MVHLTPRSQRIQAPEPFANLFQLANVRVGGGLAYTPRPHVVSFVLLSSVTLLIAIRFRSWLGGYLFLVMGLISLRQFAPGGRDPPVLSGGRQVERAAAVGRHGNALYVLRALFMTAVQVGGAAVALELASL